MRPRHFPVTLLIYAVILNLRNSVEAKPKPKSKCTVLHKWQRLDTQKWMKEILDLHMIWFLSEWIFPFAGNPEADPVAWDWQNEPHNLPVFSPYPFSKVAPETSEPSFLKINRNVSVKVGETAHLPCRVKNLDRNTVRISTSDSTHLSKRAKKKWEELTMHDIISGLVDPG